MCRYGRGDSARGSPIRGQPAYATKPPKGPRRRAKRWCEGISAKSHCMHVVNCCIGESPPFIKDHFDADTNTSRTPERRWATYSRPRIGVRSHTGRVRPSPQTYRGSGPALFACENPARGVNRTSTQLYRVRTRSRPRVSFPLVAGSRGSTARRFRRVSCPASAGPQILKFDDYGPTSEVVG
jgi:hypothetical protein